MTERGPRAAPKGPPLLLIRGLSNTYVSRSYGLFGKRELKPVLRDINLEIRPGEIFGLMGESGCGKSTLARCILGLIDYRGEILIDGSPPPLKRSPGGGQMRGPRPHLPPQGMVFQDPGASLNPVKRVGWLLEEPLVIHRRGGPEERAALVDEMLLRVGLESSYKKRRVNELSGGQKQRVCIGRALILRPKLLIADEATSSLDVSVGAQILNLFRELKADLGLGILFISHDPGAVEYLCDRVALMKEGRIVELKITAP